MIIVFSVSLWTLSIRSMAFLPVAGSNAANGSSNKRMSTSSTRTPASDTLCFCPPDKSSGLTERKSSISTIDAASYTSLCILSISTSLFSKEKAMSSATLKPTNWPSVSCNTVPTILDKSETSVVLTSFPFTVSDPSIFPSITCGINPFMQLPSVDFPDPDGPRIRIFSPSLISRLIDLSVGFFCALYVKEKSLNFIILEVFLFQVLAC